MTDFIATILILVLLSPSIIVLTVLMARGAHRLWCSDKLIRKDRNKFQLTLAPTRAGALWMAKRTRFRSAG
jgi:hypothetical protein